MKQQNRGQAALEFLLTYSWAILVVIVIIGALAYFGVLNPQNFIPERCTFSAGLSCEDYVYDSTNSELVLRITNGLGRGINIGSITIDSTDLQNPSACQAQDSTGTDIDFATNNLTLQNGESADVTITNCPVVAGTSKMRAETQVDYTFSGGLNVPKTISGEVFVNAE